jgi:diguanylate cyclase (GGDEF)-like protein
MLLVDIDNLKMINDLHGHVTGDIVLAKAAAAIRESVREGDECARIGDEFLIFASDCDMDGATEIARRILAKVLAQEIPLVGATFTVSIGIATHKGAGADFSRMYVEADDALHQARAQRRNGIALFGPTTAGAFQSDTF